MTRTDELLARQAQWQRSRRSLSWPEKIRQAERLRPSLEAFRSMRMNRIRMRERPPQRRDPDGTAANSVAPDRARLCSDGTGSESF